MAQVRPEPNLGRCILTPQPSRQKFTAKRTGNLLPMEHSLQSKTTATPINKQPQVVSTAVRPGNYWALDLGCVTTTSSTNNDRPRYVAPTAKMESSQARKDREAAIAYVGKGKARATSPVSPVVDNDGASEQGEPLVTSDTMPNSQESQQLAVEDAKRYQEEVDRYESLRDCEDKDFSDPGSQEEDSQTQEDLSERPKRRHRRTARDSVISLQDDPEQPQSSEAQSNATNRTSVKQRQLPIQQKPVEQTPIQQTPTQQVRVQQTSVQRMQQTPP